MKSIHTEKRHKKDQRKLERELISYEQNEEDKQSSLYHLLRYVVNIELLSSLIYRSRSKKGRLSPENESSLSQRISYVLRHQHHEVDVFREWLHNYRSIWRREWPLFAMVAILFIASCQIGYFFGSEDEELVTAFMPQHLQEMIQSNTKWFDRLQDNPWLGALEIGLNNAMVCIKIMVASSLLGIGGLILLIYNGFHIGSIVGYAMKHNFHDQLINFISTHGPLELTLIVASAFCGLLVGRCFFRFRVGNFANRLQRGAADAFTVLMGILPWILFIALFEGFVSPFHFFTLEQKMTLGGVLALSFWLWTFYPTKPAQPEARDLRSK